MDSLRWDWSDMEECKYYCEGYYSDDIGYEETDKINACGLTQTGYHEMSYKKCSDITNCYYKQLLAEQAKNKELENALEQQKQYCRDFKLFQIKNVDDLQAKNGKLTECFIPLNQKK